MGGFQYPPIKSDTHGGIFTSSVSAFLWRATCQVTGGPTIGKLIAEGNKLRENSGSMYEIDLRMKLPQRV